VAGPTLITGASGLIGSWVGRRWTAADGELITVDHHTVDLLAHGTPAALVRRIEPARIVHLAWSASGTPGYRQAPDNAAWVRATLELVTAADEAGARMWVTGTAVDADRDPSDRYATAKRELRAALRESVDRGRLGWFRPFYVFDPAVGRPALVAAATAARESGVPVTLRTPHSKHDFVHAADVGSAIVTAVQHDIRGNVDIGSGTVRTVVDLVVALGA
jgi:nucleoside-diphosphate-sugar epimerase